MRTFFLTLILYTGFDMLWVGSIGKSFIKQQAGVLLSERVDWVAAVLFYFIFAAGLSYFAILPGKTAGQALFNGAFFGLVTYGTYELVNRALLANWPWKLVFVDMAYGVAACALVSFLVWKINGFLG